MLFLLVQFRDTVQKRSRPYTPTKYPHIKHYPTHWDSVAYKLVGLCSVGGNGSSLGKLMQITGRMYRPHTDSTQD